MVSGCYRETKKIAALRLNILNKPLLLHTAKYKVKQEKLRNHNDKLLWFCEMENINKLNKTDYIDTNWI